MKLQLDRFSGGHDSTLGMLSADGRWLGCFTLEDEGRSQKVFGETRIPAGDYALTLRTFGGFHKRYAFRFPAFHKGMIELLEVRGFTDILIHCGNTDDETAGCLLVGDGASQNVAGRKGSLVRSVAAYRRIYPLIATALLGARSVRIRIRDPMVLNDRLATVGSVG